MIKDRRSVPIDSKLKNIKLTNLYRVLLYIKKHSDCPLGWELSLLRENKYVNVDGSFLPYKRIVTLNIKGMWLLFLLENTSLQQLKNNLKPY